MDFTTLSIADLIAFDYQSLSAEDLAAYRAELRTRAEAIAAGTPTQAQVQEATDLHTRFTESREFARSQEPASEEQAEALSALSFDDEAEEEVEEPVVEAEVEEQPEAEVEVAEVEAEVEAEPVAAAVRPAQVTTSTANTAAFNTGSTTTTASTATLTMERPGRRPERPARRGADLITITAAADTQFDTGSEVTLQQLGEAVQYRLDGMPAPEGDGETEDLRKFKVGQVAIPFTHQLTPQMSNDDIDTVMREVADERKITNLRTGQEFDSLVAANGWCAPSETLYDLCAGEVVDGILSVAEVQVNRGGFKHTTGIDFSTIYSGVGFLQTEAQAIAGTSKTCYEVPCPTFVDERLDAIGLCIKVPILLEVGYPEAVKRVMSASMIAHQYKVNASVISRILTIAGAALDPTPDFASAFGELLNTLDIEAEILRQKYRLGATASLEVVLPVWSKSVIRNELGLRNGRPPEAVTDAEIMAHFTARHFNVQFVYGWQELAGTELTWPATVEALIYPAGTLVKGVSNVINLSAVYDAASLATNIYTGLFFEQGLLVAKMCYEVRRITVPVTGAFTGKTGAAAL